MTVKIVLDHRHYGAHSPVSETEIPGEFSDYATPLALPNPHRDEFAVDEDALLAALPEGFLPVPARSVLLMVSDEDGGTALSGLSRFRPWAKYFDAYTLNVCKPDAPAAEPARPFAGGPLPNHVTELDEGAYLIEMPRTEADR